MRWLSRCTVDKTGNVFQCASSRLGNKVGPTVPAGIAARTRSRVIVPLSGWMASYGSERVEKARADGVSSPPPV